MKKLDLKTWQSFIKSLNEMFPWTGKFLKVKYGIIKEELRPEYYTFGASPLIKKIIQPNGQWDEFLPTDERQQGRRIETMSCTCFSLLNCIETLAKKKLDETWNKSDRYTAKLSGVSQNGNIMSRVLDSVRKHDGAVNEDVWPSNIDTFSWNEFFSAVPDDVHQKGLSWLNDYEFGYEAVWNTASQLKEALKYSPLYVGGYAWAESNGLYRSYGSANHCFMIYGYVEGKYWKAYDSYEPFKKKLAWNYQIYFPKLITLSKRDAIWNMAELKKLRDRGLMYIMRVLGHGEIYRIDDDKLTYLSPQEWNSQFVAELSSEKKLVGINEEDFNKLIQ